MRRYEIVTRYSLNSFSFSYFLKEKSATKKGQLHFIKVHIPWEVMLFYAEELNFKGPLKVRSLTTQAGLRKDSKIMKSLISKEFFQSSSKGKKKNFSFN